MVCAGQAVPNAHALVVRLRGWRLMGVASSPQPQYSVTLPVPSVLTLALILPCVLHVPGLPALLISFVSSWCSVWGTQARGYTNLGTPAPSCLPYTFGAGWGVVLLSPFPALPACVPAPLGCQSR